MCRGKNECSELGTDPVKLDTDCLLRPPSWIDEEISKFVQALDQLIEGNREICLNILFNIRSYEITDWFIEHGQMSGRHRKNLFGIPKPELIPENLRDSLRAPKKYQNAVFNRDNYHCRYCGSRLISQQVIKTFIKALDSEQFKRGPTNLDTHGILHAAWPVADHVVPWNMGGKTNLENLVASCAACNYGKDGYTCEQIGISNPYTRVPIQDGWDGLVSKELKLKKLYNNAVKHRSASLHWTYFK
jgi:5-methylcytosine-specific restriction endonuclease McrA